jgi:hypothetical protein
VSIEGLVFHLRFGNQPHGVVVKIDQSLIAHRLEPFTALLS